ncbi:hypothetical protein ABIB92_008399 [Bradyrhizobium sp. JR5.3]
MTMTPNIRSEESDLAICNLCRTIVLSRNSASRFALFEKAGPVDHRHVIVIRQMLDVVAHDIAQGLSVPIPMAQNCLLPPRAGIASRLRPHATGVALVIPEQTFQEQAGIRRTRSCAESTIEATVMI